MSGNKRTTIQKLRALQTRLLLVGIVLAIASIACIVLLNHETKPELELPTETLTSMPKKWAVPSETTETPPELSKSEDEMPPDQTTATASNQGADATDKTIADATEAVSKPVERETNEASAASVNTEGNDAVPESAEEANEAVAESANTEGNEVVPEPAEEEVNKSSPEPVEEPSESMDVTVPKEESEPTVAGASAATTEATVATEPTVVMPPPQVLPSVPTVSPMTAPEETSFQEVGPAEKHQNGWAIAAILLNVLLGADMIALAIIHSRLKKEMNRRVTPVWHPEQPKIGKVHGIGTRSYQQDSLGLTQVLGGIGTLAMVADGMGGLAGGDQVSQQIIMSGLNYGAAITSCQETNPLVDMVRSINADINRMLGLDLIYKCGSTLIAVLTVKDRFHWISIGDSRIYLYRAGFVNQLNTDHDLMQLWMPEILSGDRSYAAATQDPEGRKVTSFIGMGDLKYMDYSRQAIRLRPGDRLILVTDGVYGAVPPETMAAIFKANQNVSDAAQALDQAVRVAALPHQDNYTALILGF